MELSIDEIYAKIGLEVRAYAVTFKGELCGTTGNGLYRRYHYLITESPDINALVGPTIKTMVEIGFNNLCAIVCKENKIRIELSDSEYTEYVDIHVGNDGINIICGDTKLGAHDEQTSGPNLIWAATQYRKQFTRAFFDALPQPIAEEVDSEFAFFCVFGCGSAASDPI